MYDVRLTESYFPAQNDDSVLDTTVGGILRAAAAAVPDGVALVEATQSGEIGRRWTYRQLLDESERTALGLVSAYAPGERIAVWAPNIPEWVILELGVALAGLTLVTVNPAYQAGELAYVLAQSRAVALFMVDEFRGNPMHSIADEVRRKLPDLREIVDVRGEGPISGRPAPAVELPDVGPDDPVQIQYTSGTTGFPKGAVLHHRGLTNNARLVVARMGTGPGDVYLNPMPMFHTSGCGIATLGCIQSLSTQIIAALFDPARMLDLMESESVTAMFGVPTMLVGMLEAQSASPRDVSSVRVAVSGGAMVSPEIVRRVQVTFGCGFEIVYGQTETSPVLTQTGLDEARDDATETVGQPLPCTEISIRDSTTNRVVAVGEVGEICSRGYCNMLEYNDDPESTAATVDAEGWLHTGDLGTMDARGYVKVTGRVKEMIIRGGENLFPAEIENVMLEHPGVAEVAVVGIPDERWGEVVACFLRPASAERPTVDELVAHCRGALSPQKTPLYWVFVEGWPLTGSNKIRKFVLRDRFVAGEYRPESRR